MSSLPIRHGSPRSASPKDCVAASATPLSIDMEGSELSNHKLPRRYDQDVHSRENEDGAESRGLLSGEQTLYDEKMDWRDRTWSKKWMTIAGSVLIVLILGASLSRPYLRQARAPPHPNSLYGGNELRSNGTHDFKRTVLLVSIDGLRADYLDRGLTPHLLDISKKGLRAKYMKSIFPTLTFPNHWAIMTGLYAESHGIIANNFWDPRTQTEFHYNRESSTWIPSWWFGEPMWETTGRAGVISANLMWPGPPKTMTGASPTYFVPWKDKVSLSAKLNQVMKWIDLPLEERPQLILAYEPSLDQAGHKYGPNSKGVNETLKYVDSFARDLHTSLVARNLTEIVDIVFVSDHGMTDTSHPELLYLDDMLGEEGLAAVEHADGWPAKGLRFSPSANESHYLQLLLDSAAAHPEKYSVYTLETMPQRYHFTNNERIAPVYIVPNIGYVLTTKKEGDVGLTNGNHGYDNEEPSMRAMFVAHGPFSTNVKDVTSKRKRSISDWFSPSKPSGWESIDGSTYVMDGFENVQVYGLIMKLLGIESWSARNNGTAGIWDKYF